MQLKLCLVHGNLNYNRFKVLEDWTVAIDSGKSVDVIYLDFQKAVDRVPHNRLLSKLIRSYGSI